MWILYGLSLKQHVVLAVATTEPDHYDFVFRVHTQLNHVGVAKLWDLLSRYRSLNRARNEVTRELVDRVVREGQECKVTKATRGVSPGLSPHSRATEHGQVYVMDFFGPLNVANADGMRYVVTLVDAFTRWVHFIRP